MKISRMVFNLQSRQQQYMVEMAIFHVQKGNDFRTRKPKVMVHAFCMLSHDALHLCEVSLNISTCIRVMERTEGETPD